MAPNHHTNPPAHSTGPRKVIWLAALLLTLLHQDFWLWDNTRLLLGFLPSGLAYHLLFSLFAATLWAAAVRWAWPSDWEAWAESPNPHQPGPETHPKSAP